MSVHRDFYRTFAADDGGAVTVDWVVLTAALVGLSIAVLMNVASGVQDLGDNVDNCLSYDLPTLMTDDSLSFDRKLKRMERWCSDSIH